MSDHSLLSASSADRWTKCPISVTATDESRTSEAAAEGTALHGVCETVLRGGDWPAIGSTLEADGFTFEFTDDRKADCKVYTDYVTSLPWQGTYQVEQRIHYGRALATPHNLSFGTADCSGFTVGLEGRTLRIIDLKMGRKPVSPKENPQEALYGAGVLEGLSDVMLLPRSFPVSFEIVQPRLSRKPFVWLTTVGWIEDMTAQMRPAATAAVRFKQGTASAVDQARFPELPGGHCGYCRRKAQCTTFQAEVSRIAQPGAGVQWNPTVFAMRDSIKSYLEDLEQMAFDEAMRGTPYPGTKLVKGRAGKSTLLVPESQIRAKAKLMGIENQVVKTEEVWATPAKIRDALKRGGMSSEEVQAFINTPEGAPQIADAADPRPSIEQTATNSFAGIAR
jgi:hypothetical protein